MNNTVTLVGNLGQDPELRYTAKGLAQVRFSVATSYGKDDNKKTTWHSCVAWGEMAEAIASEFVKGNRAIVMGRYEVSEYTTKNGEKKKTHEVIVDDCGTSLRWGKSEKRAKYSDNPSMSGNRETFDEEEPF